MSRLADCWIGLWAALLIWGAAGGALGNGGDEAVKTRGVFFGAEMVERARANAAAHPWAAEIQQQVIRAAEGWMDFSDEQLWDLMFGPTITRSWMVWSDGFCPACKQGVPMYTWEIAALERPWKVRCPHCKESFPKNDFHAFYRSGLDEHGVFDPARADRSLLFNAEHSDPAHPLHTFGVDDGEGYVEGDHRWRFIGAYLIYGQWKQAIVGGIRSLAAAYVVTGDEAYAHKAGVLLDRVADLYPTFDFKEQGMVYEVPGAAGYVSTWHDACPETRDLAVAYDQVFEALRDDPDLVAFLSAQAERYRLDNPKASFADIQRNIEGGILRDALQNRRKIESNYPQTDLTIAIIHTILGWPANRQEVYELLAGVLDRATAVDGVTGEKGLSGYAASAVNGTAVLLETYARMDPQFLPWALERQPRLRETFRFHADTWCLGAYYPTSGDAGGFAQPVRRYVGVGFSRNPGLGPSSYSLFWRFYRLTGDPVYAQLMYGANQGVEGLPYDLFAEDPAAVQHEIAAAVAQHGPALRVASVNKQQWRLAILRSGEGADARALWLDYDSGGGHGHADGMNLGLFARGLDLLPDFGYPPVQYGGWGSPRARWYTMTAAHNTVTVDGSNTRRAQGRTTLWADGERVHAVRASGPELIDGRQFERTAALVDISDRDFYVLDILRVVGGADHARFTYSHYGEVTTAGLSLQPAPDYGHDTQTRGFACDPAPAPGWSVEWKVEDRLQLLPAGSEVRLRLTDLTADAQAWTGEAWIAVRGYNVDEEEWIPLAMARRQGEQEPLASTFVAVLEPYQGESQIASIRRLPLETVRGERFGAADVAIEVRLRDGRRDLLVAADVENPLGVRPSRSQGYVLVQPEWGLRLNGEAALVRLDASGRVERVVLCRGKSLRVGEAALELGAKQELMEVTFDDARAAVVRGDPQAVKRITRAP